MQIKCPKCSWKPQDDSLWTCESCSYEFQIFNKNATCPQCEFEHIDIYCLEWEGGCGLMSPYLDWFEGIDEKLLDINVKKLFN